MLFGILKNKIGDSYRSGHARNEVPSEPGDLPLESLPSQDEEVITNLCIGELLQQLSGTDRTVLLLACVNDMSISDIASLLGKSEGSIRTRLSRVKANLRRDGIPRVL
jgi:DNA-directed RNA polymerase specialized sigma24 family protein